MAYLHGLHTAAACEPFLLLVQIARRDLKDAKDEADSREYSFQKELATAQKLAALYKEASEERNKKVAELEGIMREMQSHLEVGRVDVQCSNIEVD